MDSESDISGPRRGLDCAFVSGLGGTELVFGTSKGMRSVVDMGSRGGRVDEWRVLWL